MLIPKGGGKDFHIIELVEALWKTTTGITNQRLTTAITYHNSLHGFCTGHGEGTFILETKLIHRLAAMMGAVLHTVFLDLQKAYDALDWVRCLDILAGYDVGPWAIRLL